MITLIDYGSGNIHAIANIYKRLNIPFKMTFNPEELLKAEKLILPGVGDFDETMKLFEKNGVKEALNEAVVHKKIPILGVCVGMQIMGNSSEEGELNGFGWIKGKVRRLSTENLNQKPHLPHLGWNSVSFDPESFLFKEVGGEQGFYFLHSYYFDCEDTTNIYATTQYGDEFASAINRQNVFGVQFHPEKSHKNGIRIFKNFYDFNA
jgi:glutamine amidotransferase